MRCIICKTKYQETNCPVCKTSNWLKEKVTVVLTREDMFGLANAISDASRSDVEFTMIKDRKIRKLFANAIQKRHELWLKIIHVVQNQQPRRDEG